MPSPRFSLTARRGILPHPPLREMLVVYYVLLFVVWWVKPLCLKEEVWDQCRLRWGGGG